MATATVHVQNWMKQHWVCVDAAGAIIDLPTAPTAPTATHKRMHGDIVSPTTGALIQRAASKIVGIIDILNRTRYGTTPRGVPMYLMHPLDPAHPPFVVALKTKPATNVLAVVKYEHWDDTWPRAGLEKIIGPVGDLTSELQAMLHTFPPAAVGVDDAVTGGDCSGTSDDAWDVVLHIDPPGCKDVDDVLFWKAAGTGRVRFGIGIADVAAWIPEMSPVDVAARARGSTLYRDGEAIEPMLPAAISESRASLRSDGVARPAVCLTFELARDAEGVWRCDGGARWERHALRVSESYTYDSIHCAAAAARAADVRAFIGAVCGGIELGSDSHEWIEAAMVAYNRRAGEDLQGAGVGILRSHCGAAGTSDQYQSLATATGCSEIAWLGAAAGQYVTPANNSGHAGLGVACYAHASSPLRRYVDLINQRWIRAIHFGFPPPSASGAEAVISLNARSKRIRQLERDMYFLTQVLGRGGDPKPTAATAFLLAHKAAPTEGVDRWRAYVPEWKRVVTCVLAATDAGAAAAGSRVDIRMYFDARQADARRRFVYRLFPILSTP
jgi:hypothetical protein